MDFHKKIFKVGIIGGNGKMGKLFVRFFSKLGWEVLVASRHTAMSVEECAKKSDVLIVCVSIQQTESVIKRVASLVRKDGLLMDFTSIKKAPFDLMKQQAVCEVVGAHPIFGPSVKSFLGQVMVLCPLKKNGKWFGLIKKLFESAGMRVCVSTPNNHDRVMSIVQGLTHFTSINFAATLRVLCKKMKFSYDELAEYASPIYGIRMDVANRILAQDAEMYADIALENEATAKVLREYLRVSKKLLKCVTSKNKEGFVEHFNEASDFLGDVKRKSSERIDEIIANVSKHKSKDV